MHVLEETGERRAMKGTIYRYALLDPRPSPEAEQRNDGILGTTTLGIEVTVPVRDGAG